MKNAVYCLPILLLFSLLDLGILQAQDTPSIPKKSWFDQLSIRGYVQVRYNGLETNENLSCAQCDASWGSEESFFIRRARVIIYGQINPRVYVYIQPDFASSPSSGVLHFAQLRDAYFDVGIDNKNEFRFRIGQSKVPFGFENMQSSQNRLPLDRNDALNSAVSNERDLGVFFYWAPEEKRKLFSSLVKDGLKGSGDYGIFGVGIYNGQTANRPELNSNKHVAARLTWPFLLKSQIIETSIQAYSGVFNINESSRSEGVGVLANGNYADERLGGSFVLYPKPIGIQAEYNVGRGPEFNKRTDSIEVRNLEGGYVTLSGKFSIKNQVIIPFTRMQYYLGGKKHETDARSYKVNELEFGVEWQPVPQFELVAMYVKSSRRYEDFVNQDNHQKGSLLRIQAQVNF